MKGGCTSELSKRIKSAMDDSEKARHDSEYKELLALFVAMLKSSDMEEALYELSEKRLEYAVKHVLDGLDVDYDQAMILLKNQDDNSLTQHDKDLRDRILAAVLNLIDFSVCEEYQLYDEVNELVGDGEIDFNSDDYEDIIAICEKYNDQYAAIENGDIKYAGAMAALWLKVSAGDYLVYWTQNDSHVRPSHMALQGYAAHKDEFPSWMIPPIDYNCRCFLEVLDMGYAHSDARNIKGSAKEVKKPNSVSDVYSESLAKCGRIFGPAHSYFAIKESDKDMLAGFVERLKEKYYVG